MAKAWIGLVGTALLSATLLGGCSREHDSSTPLPSPTMDRHAATADSGQAMTLEGLYALPSLIGTTPRFPVWSGDSSALAFAWNDQGYPFLDLWLREGDNAPRQLTRHGDDPALAGGRGISELTWVGGADGHIAYVMGGQLHLARADGMTAPQPAVGNRVRRLQASPDGEYLAFIAVASAATAGSSDGSLWIGRVADGAISAVRQLVDPGAAMVGVESFEWSADGQRIAFVQADNREVPRRQLHYEANGGEQQVYEVSRSFPGEKTTARRLGSIDVNGDTIQWYPLEDVEFPIWQYGLSADGTRLFASTSDYVIKQHTVYVFDVASGEGEVFYTHHEPNNVIPGWQVAWAPGDEGLVLQIDRDGFYHLYHQAESGGDLRQITRGEWEVERFELDRAGAQLYFVANMPHPSERQVFRVPVAGGEVQRLTSTAGTWEPFFAPDYARVALHFSNDTTPPDLYLRSLADGSDIEPLTRSPRAAFAAYDWATVSYPSFQSHIDGTVLHARLSVPPDFDPARSYPLIVGSVYPDALRNQWGGRTAHPTWGLDQYFVAQGYLVLNVNMRGSWGHGKAHSQGIIRDYGGIDTDDIESGVRHLVAQGVVDPERVGLWGSSYGGLMTLMSLFKKPGVYAAGIAGAPATNVWHAFPAQMWIMGERKGDDYPARYERQSALFHSAGLEDPLMIIHGSRDSVVLYSDTIALVERMIAQTKDFELLTLPGGNHSWATDSPEQTLFAFRAMAAFFDRHVKNRHVPAATQ